MKTILFARVSTKEQAEEGYSLDSQIKLLSHYANGRFDIVKKFIVPESASGKQERKMFHQMLEYLKLHPQVKIVLCEKVDRITRNIKDADKMDDWLNEDEERQIHFVKQSLIIHKNAKSHEKFQWDIYIALARQYSNNLSEETKKGLEEKAAQGWYPGNMKRGYRTVGDAGHKVWVIDTSPESEAPFIKRSFELYSTGEFTTHTLGKKLFEEGWKSQAGTPIGKSEMHKLLKDCFYCGEFLWHKKLFTKANHAPLVSKELFYLVQEKITRKITGKYKKHKFLFGGLIKCGECSRSVIADTKKGHNYYHCTRFETNCTQRRYIREEDLERQMVGIFNDLEVKDRELSEWIRIALKESHVTEADYHNSAIAELNRQYALVQQRLDALYDDKVDGNITKEVYQRKFEQYNKDLENILASLHLHKQANISYFELGSNIFELSQKARKIYESITNPADKRVLFNFVFSNLVLKDKKLDAIYTPAFSVIANAAKNGSWLPGRDSNPNTMDQNHVSYH